MVLTMRVLSILLLINCSVFAGSLSSTKQAGMVDEIDSLVLSKLKEVKAKPSKRIDDEVFLRRIYLDIVGRIPTYKEAKQFLDSRSSTKRNKLIDQLLDSPGYVSHNYNYWADVLRSTTKMKKISGDNYINFIKEFIRIDKPYNKFVYEMLSANGAAYKHGNGATGYYMRDANMPLDNMANTMQIFLGTSMVCAQCHDHPFDKWTQMDFYKLAAFTSGIQTKNGRSKTDPRSSMIAKATKESKKDDRDKYRIYKKVNDVMFSAVNHKGAGQIQLPHDYDYDDAKPNEMVKAETPFGPEVSLNYQAEKPVTQKTKKRKKKKTRKKKKAPLTDINSRDAFAKWAVSRSNPMFTKVIVNRMWDKVMGAPLAGPLLNFSLKNQGVNSKLTAKLQEQMKAVNYSLKNFMRILYKSRTYQQQSLTADVAASQKNYFGGPHLKRLSAEQLWDSLLSLAVEFPDSKISTSTQSSGGSLFSYLDKKTASEVIEMVNKSDGKNYLKQFEKMGSAKTMTMMAKSSGAKKPQDKMAELRKLVRELKAARKKKDVLLTSRLKQKVAKLRAEVGDKATQKKIVRNESNKVFSRASEVKSPAGPGHFLRRFGQSDRQVIDGASVEGSVPQALTLLNGKIEDYLTLNPVSNINRNLNEAKNWSDKITVAYISVLGRKPQASEMSMFSTQFKRNPEQAQKDLVWILINSNEFMFKR